MLVLTVGPPSRAANGTESITFPSATAIMADDTGAMRQYGFISAGAGTFYTKTSNLLSEGS